MVELDQFKYTLSTYEKPLQEVRESLNLDAKIRRIDELDKTMEEPSFWEDAELSTRLVKEAKHLKDTVAEFNRLQNQYEEIGLMIEMGYEENDPAIVPEIQKMVDEFSDELEALAAPYPFDGRIRRQQCHHAPQRRSRRDRILRLVQHPLPDVLPVGGEQGLFRGDVRLSGR